MTKYQSDTIIPVTGEPLPTEVRAELADVYRRNQLHRFPTVEVRAWNEPWSLPNEWRLHVSVPDTEWARTAEVLR